MWYVVQVIGGQEDAAVLKIQKQASNETFKTVFVPKYEIRKHYSGAWKTRREVLFPGYVFVDTKTPDVFRQELNKVTTITKLLSGETETGKKKFIPLSNEEKTLISSFVGDEDHVMKMSEGIIEGDQIMYAIIAILIKVDDPKGPVFFSQERVGKDGRTFRMLKFRSMCVDAEDRLAELRELNEKTGPVFKIAEDPRITRVGKWLRKLSLDEFPQFINVLRSDIPLRILKTRLEFSEKSMGAFALPAKSSTNKEKVFSQVVSCFASGLRMRRISGFNCKRVGSMGGQFLAKPVFKEACA